MINLKKLGLSALAGSLVAVSAQAGEMAVTGAANVTYKEKGSGTADSIGTDKDVSFTGTGELDNGWNFVVSTTLNDAYAVSSSYTSITMGSMGTVAFGADTGGVSGGYDEEVPQAYEQTSDGQQNSANIVGNRMDSNMIVYNSPSFELGMGVNAKFGLEYSKSANGTAANDGGTATDSDASTNVSDQFGRGMGLGVTLSYDTLSFGAYGATRENLTSKTAEQTNAVVGNDKRGDDVQGVAFVKYAYGPVAIGYSAAYHDSGLSGNAVASTTAKTVGEASGYFDARSMSIAFNINDNLSVSLTETVDTYNPQSKVGAEREVEQDTTAIQVAYSMGAMSIKAYNMDTSNPGYDEDAEDVSVNEIALGLAF